MKTHLDVIQAALQHIRVVAADDPVVAVDAAFCKETLESIIPEIGTEIGGEIVGWDWSTSIPEVSFVALAKLLATDVMHSFGASAPTTRARAYMRLMATIRKDDRVEDEPFPVDYF